MKSKELILLIQEADPSGEEFVCINGHEAILGVAPMPAYYDGHLEVFTWNGKPGISDENQPTGGKIIRTGQRIDILASTLKSRATENWWDGEEFPLEVIGDTPDQKYATEFQNERNKYFKAKLC